MGTASRQLTFFLIFLLTSLIVDEVITLNENKPNYNVDDGMEHYKLDFISLEDQYYSRVKRQEPETPTKLTTSQESTSAVPATTTTLKNDPLMGNRNKGYIDPTELEGILEKDINIPEKTINDTIQKSKEFDDVKSDNHKYYSAEFISNQQFWVDFESLPSRMVKEHEMLSKSYRRAATIPLTFNFPFYGHNVTNITIATGGFLYTGDYVHAWLAATQYIAPLMANFDTSQNENAKIRYADNGTALIVEWENVHLKARDNSETSDVNVSPFSFQVILHSNGDIVFAYKNIPLAINLIGDKDHPVKVGLSDAYIIDRTIFFVRRKTIYEYHRLDLREYNITDSSAIYFKALETCNGKTSCQSCIDTRIPDPDDESEDGGRSLECKWCPALQRCSDGMDRLRQQWLMSNCDTFNNKKGSAECDTIFNNYNHQESGRGSMSKDIIHDHHEAMGKSDERKPYGGHHYQAGIVTISIVILFVISMTAWFVYAYFFPHSWSGQLLIKYRPSHWQWRRAEPRYTAASIHM